MDIDFQSCIVNGKISTDCAKKLNDDKYLVCDNINLKTKGILHRMGMFTSFRHVNVDYIIPSNTLFTYKNGEIVSDCVIPQKMTYTDQKWYDSFIGDPKYAYDFTDDPFLDVRLKVNELHCCTNTSSFQKFK